MSAHPQELVEMHGQLFPAHPAVRQPSLDELWQVLMEHGERAVGELARRRAEDIERLEKYPFEYPFVIKPLWEDADERLKFCRLLVLLGGNRSSKTHYAIDRIVRDAVARPNLQVLILHETEQRSKLHHQALVYKLLPAEWKPTEDKKIKRTLRTKISYTVADGFSGNILALPNGTVIQFGFYSQDVKSYEGGAYDWIFADENLPLAWLKTLLFRLYSRGGKMLWGFTCIKGITPAMAHVVNGAKTTQSLRAELLPADHRAAENQDFPPGHMPYLQESAQRGVSVIYFHTKFNPFSGYEAMAAEMGSNLPPVELERRFYGYARNLVARACPNFSAAHILKDQEGKPYPIPPAETITWWNAIDPAGRRNFFLLWGWVDEHGRIMVWDEWPSVSELGEWAMQSESAFRHDGDPGPAQQSLGWGVEQYKRMILKREAKMGPVEYRWGDPRAIAQAAAAMEAGGSTLVERFAEEQKSGPDGEEVTGPALYIQPAPGKHEEVGLMDINDHLSYRQDQPVAALVNEPRLYVHERCENLIWALNNYTGMDGEKAACKDPMDTLRYVVTAAPVHTGGVSEHEADGGGWS